MAIASLSCRSLFPDIGGPMKNSWQALFAPKHGTARHHCQERLGNATANYHFKDIAKLHQATPNHVWRMLRGVLVKREAWTMHTRGRLLAGERKLRKVLESIGQSKFWLLLDLAGLEGEVWPWARLPQLTMSSMHWCKWYCVA
jgi:hypothetical protein